MVGAKQHIETNDGYLGKRCQTARSKSHSSSIPIGRLLANLDEYSNIDMQNFLPTLCNICLDIFIDLYSETSDKLQSALPMKSFYSNNIDTISLLGKFFEGYTKQEVYRHMLKGWVNVNDIAKTFGIPIEEIDSILNEMKRLELIEERTENDNDTEIQVRALYKEFIVEMV